MPISVKCPACAATVPGKFEYEAPVTCDLCGEAFKAPSRPVAKAAPPKVEAQPVPPPQPVPPTGPAADFDFDKKPERPERPERPRRPAERPAKAGREERDDRPKPRRPRDEPRERPARDDRPRRRPEPQRSPMGLIIGGVLGGLFLLLLAAGGGVLYLTKQARQARDEQEARALQEARFAEDARSRARAEQDAWREEMNRQQQNANPVAPNNPELPFNPGAGPVPGAFPPAPAVPPGFGPGALQPVVPVPPAEPPQPPQPVGPPVPPFDAPKNPYSPGSQTKLRELRSVDLPKLPAAPKNNQPWNQPVNEYTKLLFAPKHDLLFALSPKSVWVYDVKAGKEVGTQTPTETFTDLSLSPDGSVLFVADYGGENIGYGTPLKPSRVHRFDLASRKWEDRKAPKIAYRAEAVDGTRVLLLERDQWVSVTLNKWEEDGVGIRELARTGSDYYGDIEYDPRTGRIYHGSTGSSSQQISVREVVGNELKVVGDTGTYGSASGGGPTTVLSQDGSRLYYGTIQVGTADVKKNLQKMQGMIYAASRDIAFSEKAYYRTTTGSKLGEFEFKTTTGGDPRGFGGGGAPTIAVSPDGLSVWVVDRDKNAARQFALEGEK